MKFLNNILAKAGLIVDGVTQLNTIANATIDTDKFLVSDGGVIKYRTGAELASDIGPGNLSVSTVKHIVKLGVSAAKGQAVYVSSSDGTNMIVSKASNASEATSSKTFGLLETGGVLNDQVYVVTEGLLSGLDTSTANAGDPVWLGTNGNLIFGLLNKPYAPAHLVFIGIVTRVQQNNGEIFIKVQNGFELNEIHDVQITTTPADNSVLSYENSSSLYKMKSIATLLGYTPANAARQLTINGTTYDLTTDRTWSVGTVTSIATTGPITGGTITGSGTIGITQATTSSNGYLSSTDWNTFNNKQNALTLTTTGSSGASTLVGATLNIPTYSLSGLGGVPSSRQLTINGTAYDLSADRSWSVGTVTSVGVSVPTGLSVSNTPVTGSGTIAITFTAGYSIPTTASQTNWDTAYNNRITSLTTTGTSGAATLTSNTLNIPQYQAQGNYITSLTGEATASGPGAASVTLTNSAVIGKVLTGLNVTGGSISAADSILAAFGKLQNQVNGLAGGVTYQGAWNASTNSPSLTSSVGTKGYYYVVSVAGSTNLNGITDWKLGDWAIFNGTSWEKVDNTDAVVSVNGFTGAVSLTTANISESGNLYFTDSRARSAISLTTTGSSGAATYSSATGVFNIPQYTLSGLGGEPAIAAGTTSQYWRGDKSWQTLNTTAVPEGTNLYYTDARARASLSFTAGSGGYNSSTGVITIPTNTNQLTNGAGFITGNQSITLSGDASGSGTTAIAVTLANSGVTAGTYGGNNSIPSLVIDSKGRVTSASTVTPSGTWGINVTGSAGSLSSNGDYFAARSTGAGSSIDTFTDNGWRILTYTGYSSQLWSVNSGGSTGTVQFELEYNTPVRGFKVRNKTDNSSWSAVGWVVMTTSNQGHISGTILHSGNYNSYSPTLTGGGASGTWGINITGSAGSVDFNNLTNKTSGTGTYQTSGDFRAPIFYDSNDTSYYLDPSSSSRLRNITIVPFSSSWAEGIAFSMPSTTTWGGLRWRRERANNDGNWYIGYTALDATDDLVFGANNAGSQIDGILRMTKAGVVTNNGNQILHAGNYNSYAPTLTGGGASGTWGINITGTAASETLATVTGRGASTSTAVTFNGGATSTQYALTGGFTISNSGNYGQTSTWLGMSGHGIYTTSSTYIDLDGAASTFSVRGYNNDDFAVFANTGTANASRLIYFLPNGGSVGIGDSSPEAILHVQSEGGSTTASNTVLILQANTSSTILAGGGTAILFRGVSSGGNIQNYEQARIRTVGYASNNSHGFAIDVKPNAATSLTNALFIGSDSAATFASSVTAGSFIKSGGTSSQFLKADGSVDSNTYLTSTNTDFTYNSSLTLSTSWQDTGVTNSNLTTSGVYMVTCLADDFAVGGGHYNETYVGTMYWFAGSTNSVNYSEIALHHMGHADNDRYIYLRTRTTPSGGGCFLQIRGNGGNSGASTYTFKFKRLM